MFQCNKSVKGFRLSRFFKKIRSPKNYVPSKNVKNRIENFLSFFQEIFHFENIKNITRNILFHRVLQDVIFGKEEDFFIKLALTLTAVKKPETTFALKHNRQALLDDVWLK